MVSWLSAGPADVRSLFQKVETLIDILRLATTPRCDEARKTDCLAIPS